LPHNSPPEKAARAPLQLPWLSRNKKNIYAFNDEDHLQEGAKSVRDNLLHFLANQGLAERAHKIYLLTHLRTWGHLFNPVSFYFVEDIHGEQLCLVAEVANTFNEQKLYVIANDKFHDGTYRDTQAKEFYISPFSNLDTQIHFNVKPPKQTLGLSINESENSEAYFFSALEGKRRPLTQNNLVLYTLLFPLITLKIVAGIHWHALMLFLKRIPVRAKSAHPELQKDVRRYLKAH
jgi:uncharacterized protein